MARKKGKGRKVRVTFYAHGKKISFMTRKK